MSDSHFIHIDRRGVDKVIIIVKENEFGETSSISGRGIFFAFHLA